MGTLQRVLILFPRLRIKAMTNYMLSIQKINIVDQPSWDKYLLVTSWDHSSQRVSNSSVTTDPSQRPRLYSLSWRMNATFSAIKSILIMFRAKTDFAIRLNHFIVLRTSLWSQKWWLTTSSGEFQVSCPKQHFLYVEKETNNNWQICICSLPFPLSIMWLAFISLLGRISSRGLRNKMVALPHVWKITAWRWH